MSTHQVKIDYPWTSYPLVVGAPMRLIALSKLACEISNAGGLGFIGAGSDVSTLESELEKAKASLTVKSSNGTLPIGVGFLLWAGEKLLQEALPLIERYKPAAVWLFAPNHPDQLTRWTQETRRVSPATKLWIQIGTVADATSCLRTCRPDVLVVQGTDAGGHGLEKCAGLLTLLPEVDDAISTLCSSSPDVHKPTLIAAGGIIDGRALAASLALGAQGAVLGTRYLACPEANIAKGYREAVLSASDGGVNTARGKLYDTLRGTTDWPAHYGGRSVLNESWYDAAKGMSVEENKRLYDDALKMGDEGWGEKARLTTYAGTGVGLVKKVQPAAEVTREVREESIQLLQARASRL